MLLQIDPVIVERVCGSISGIVIYTSQALQLDSCAWTLTVDEEPIFLVVVNVTEVERLRTLMYRHQISLRALSWTVQSINL